MLRGQSLNSRGGAGGCQGQNISHETKFRFSDFFGQQTKKPSFFHKFYKNFSFENCRVRIFISAFDRYITFFYNIWRPKNIHTCSFPLYKINGRSLNCYFLVWFVSMFKWNLPLKDF
jgi:hypothetical protein